MEVKFGALRKILRRDDLIAVFENRLKMGYRTYEIINHAELVNLINTLIGAFIAITLYLAINP